MIRFRKPSEDDPHIYRLTRDCLLPYTQKHFPDLKLNRVTLRKRLSEGITLVDWERSAFRGYVHALVTKETLWIDLLAVRKAYRRTGVGYRLLKKAEEWGKRNGARQVMLYVNEENEGAKRFYERYGYRYYNTDHLLHCEIFVKRFITHPAISFDALRMLFPV